MNQTSQSHRGNGQEPPMGVSLAKTVLITGAAGFIGRALVKRILKEDLTTCIVAIDNGSTGDLEALIKLTESGLVSASAEGKVRTVLIRADIRVPQAWQALLKSLDVAKFPPVREIYHLACPASPVAYEKFPVETLLTAVVGTCQVLIFAEQLAPKIWPTLPPPRVVHASTSEVYGDYFEGVIGDESEEGLRLGITAIPESYRGSVAFRGPRACYDEGKRAAETLVHDFMEHSQCSLDVRTVRLFNVYGPGMAPADGRVVSAFFDAALRDQELTIYGDGLQTRSLTYIDDAVDGLMQLMAVSEHGAPAVVNLGDPGGEVTVRDLAERILALVPESRSGLQFFPGRKDEPRYRVPDTSLITAAVGWVPRVTLAEGLGKTEAWMRETLAKRKEAKTMAELGVQEEVPVVVDPAGGEA